MHTLKDFAYTLPDELIARNPVLQRARSRLLHFNAATKKHAHLIFEQITSLIQPGDLMVFNDTRVIKARMHGRKRTGGRVEMFVERVINRYEVLAQLKVSKAPKPHDELYFPHDIVFVVLQREGPFYRLKLAQTALTLLQVMELIGEIPIPPYFARDATESDHTRYQTVYAKAEGSVAAPTAGLHFDESLLETLRASGVQLGFLTLHIGAGTFLPVRVENIADHHMHKEYIEVSQDLVARINATKQNGKRVIAVGTTSARALESASAQGALQAFYGETDIFIYPGYHFKTVDALITNFHLPGSSLLMLVAAFAGYDATMSLYREAIAEKYRFYSYGDAMFLA